MENKQRMIDANAIHYRETDVYCGNGNSRTMRYVTEEDIAEMPTQAAAEVAQGSNLKAEWPSLFECSVCGCESIDTYSFTPSTISYCPNCGAKMDGGADCG